MKIRSLSLVGWVAGLALLGWGSTAGARQNHPPSAPTINEPSFDGRVVNASDVHMECSAFVDQDPGDFHLCTDWEIWTIEPAERVWATECIGGVERVHTHLGDGTFENTQEGRRSLLPDLDYRLRVRHKDSSGTVTAWGPWAERLFTTAPTTAQTALELDDVASAPAPTWTGAMGAVVLGAAKTPAFLRLEAGDGRLLLEFRSGDGTSNIVTNPAEIGGHAPVRVRVNAGGLKSGLTVNESELRFTTHDGAAHTVYLPVIALGAGGEATYWVALSGATYVGESSQTEPDFSVLARSSPVPWEVQAGFKVEVVASGFRLPVNIGFVPEPLSGADAPLFYVTELYGTIKVVSRDFTVRDFATGLLNYNPTGAFPGSGEQGLAGIAVQPGTGAVFAGMLYDSTDGTSGIHYPKVVRFTSADGGRTASGEVTVLAMPGEIQGQSHQISNMSFGPDGKLYVHMGDGFYAQTALDLDSFRGKVLRMNPDGSAPSDNPFYDAADGITARDYVYAYGFRNPFGGAWRASDGHHYEVENGPAIDRFARVVRGGNYGWDGTEPTMSIMAILNWNPATAPVNVAFIEPETFGGSGFPTEKMDRAFVSLSGPTWLDGPYSVAKRVSEFVLDDQGNLVREEPALVRYIGGGRATACALAAGPDGLYFSDLYRDRDNEGPLAPGANVLRVRYVGESRFRADVRRGPAPLVVAFADASTAVAPTAWEWDFGDGATSSERSPVHTYSEPGTYSVRLNVTGAGGVVVGQRTDYIVVSETVRAAFIGGAAAPTGADAAAIAALEGAGFEVEYFEDDAPGRPRGASFAGEWNLVVGSSTMAATSVLSEFREADVGMLLWEPALLLAPYEGVAREGGIVAGQSVMTITDASHPITYGVGAGDVQVLSPAGTFTVARGELGAGVRVLGTRAGAPGDVTLLSVETGAALLEGHTAPARRAYMCLDDVAFTLLTPAGRDLFERAACWSAGLGAEVVRGPAATSVTAGDGVTMSVVARGAAPVAYQWMRNGEAIQGATQAAYEIAAAAPGDRGVYSVVVNNGCGSMESAGALLTVFCAADFDRDGVVNSQDFFGYVACFFDPMCPEADFDGDGVVNSQDFFGFVGAFFGGCE